MSSIYNFFNGLINAKKSDSQKGIYSIVTTNKFVLETALQNSVLKQDYVLIESTCNQVNQFGGYTGMTPRDFKSYVLSISNNMGFPKEKLIIGGDHIGPFPFKDEDSSIAMEKANVLIKSCIESGYSKIHVDTSMALGGDRLNESGQIDKEIIAKRCVDLVKTSEKSCKSNRSGNEFPVYVIGTDIPSPGGSDVVMSGRRVTSVSDFIDTMELTKKLFFKDKLYDAWERVIAVVVQPGVEHGDRVIIDYDRKSAKELTKILVNYPNIAFEAHTTDYQTPVNLKKMIEDKFIILKAGPSLTNAFKESIFLLNIIEEELLGFSNTKKLSRLRDVLDEEMLKNPVYWSNYYKGDEVNKKLSRKYSFFDRSRYYWENKKVVSSLELLLKNIECHKIPINLISQYFPVQYIKIRDGILGSDPLSLIRDRIRNVIDKYSYAVE